MITMTLRYHLYEWGERAYEDCYAIITAEVPDSWKEKMPEEEEVKVISVEVEKQAADYLISTYRTDMAVLNNDLFEFVAVNNKDIVIELLAEHTDCAWPD